MSIDSLREFDFESMIAPFSRTEHVPREVPEELIGTGVTAVLLRSLPVLPLVSFVYRCARRVLPLCSAPDASPFAYIHAVAAGRRKELMTRAEHATYIACVAVRLAYDTARQASSSLAEPDGPAEIQQLALSVAQETAAAISAGGTGRDDLAMAGRILRQDLEQLIRLDPPKVEDLLGRSIDPSEAGPLGSLWPEGAPAWYRAVVGDEPFRPANSADPVTPMPPTTDPTAEPTWEETHADWMRYYAAEKAGLIDPEGQHIDEWVAFYDGHVIDYGKDMVELQDRVAARLGVHWARVVVTYRGGIW